ncbi:hypothetical protein C8J57DRAFT_1134330 [Mycena rebaudengoi]|nr:hypothetical protein C8J57DRAFT_1134330 [Mycena rebaudengoi]
MPAALTLVRVIAFSVVSVFSMITLGLAASLIDTTIKFDNVYFIYATLAVAAAALTLISVPTMYTSFNPAGLLRSGPPFTRLVLDMLRPGSPSSGIVTELSIRPSLSILWLSTGANTAETGPALLFLYLDGCTNDPFFGTSLGAETGACQKTSAIEAFAFLNWIILMGYSVMVLVLALIAVNRKQNGVWKSSVAELPSSAPAGSYGGQPMQPAMYSTSGSYGGQHMEPAYGGTAGSVQAGAVHSV